MSADRSASRGTSLLSQNVGSTTACGGAFPRSSVSANAWSDFPAAMTVFPTSGYAQARPPRTSLRTEAPLRLISQTTGTATLIEWAKLALRDAKTQVLRVARVRQDKAFGTLFEQIVLPLDKFPGLTHGDTVTDVADLAERFGLQIERSLRADHARRGSWRCGSTFANCSKNRRSQARPHYRNVRWGTD